MNVENQNLFINELDHYCMDTFSVDIIANGNMDEIVRILSTQPHTLPDYIIDDMCPQPDDPDYDVDEINRVRNELIVMMIPYLNGQE